MGGSLRGVTWMKAASWRRSAKVVWPRRTASGSAPGMPVAHDAHGFTGYEADLGQAQHQFAVLGGLAACSSVEHRWPIR